MPPPILSVPNGGSVNLTCCPLFPFVSNRGNVNTLPPLSFHFKRGQHVLPPFLFISKVRTGAALAVSNGGGVWIPEVMEDTHTMWPYP